MFGFDPLYMVIAVVVFALVEVALFWAAASLGDAPQLSWGKTFVVAVLVTVVWGALSLTLVWSSGLGSAALAPENRVRAILFAMGILGVMWLIPALLYAPLVPVSIPKSMLISIFQVLLRVFLYVLMLAVLMVVLAGLQIYHGTDVRSENAPELLRVWWS